MKKKTAHETLRTSQREFRKLNESLREQWARMNKAHKLSEELHEQIKETEAHVEDGKRKSRKAR